MKQSSIRFGLIGGLNTLLDVGIFFVLVLLGVAAIPANLVSTAVTFAISFVLNRTYAFKARAGRWQLQLVLFIGVTLIALWVIQPLLISVIAPVIAHAAADLSQPVVEVIAKVLATVASMTWNYLLYHFVVFSPRWGAGKDRGGVAPEAP